MVAPKPTSVVAIYPGSFDPVTNGHLDLIERAAKLADQLVVAILRNSNKQTLFTVEERLHMLREVLAPYPHVHVESFEGLLADYATMKGASMIVRGIRAISDYEYELQMAHMNRRLQPQIETVFLMAKEEYSFLSSRMMKEVARLGGSIQGLVPTVVEQRLREKYKRER